MDSKNRVPWTRTILEDFIQEALLTSEEETVIRTRIEGWSIVKQAMHLGMGTATVSRIVARLKKKYDELNALYPTRFPYKSK